MKTFSVNFTDLIGNFWTMDWEPSTSKEMNITDADIQSVIHYIKTGTWSDAVSIAAQDCYNTLAEKIADTIIDDAVVTGYTQVEKVVERIHFFYSDGKFSKKGNILFQRCETLCERERSEENTLRMRKLLKRIIKAENLFVIKFAEDENWLVDIMTEMKCCICGTTIYDNCYSHNPYPVRPESWYGEKENRCCSFCNQRIVIPSRIRYGRNINKHHNLLMKMDYDELLNFVA